ncbi:MAG: aspartate aminotransferase family protein [Acidobacteria bacterium]|nr:aspartate aminotransferase family protein [Acidobacteriota bacterium]
MSNTPRSPKPPRPTPLTLGPDQFRALGHAVVDRLADRLAGIADGPVTPDDRPSAIRAAFDLDRPLPEQGTDAAAVLDGLVDRLFDHSLFNAHPKFLGYITAPPAPIGILGDFIASALNPNVGSWRLGPAATEIEAATVRWIVELIGYPPGAGGLLVSGGNMANFVCFFAARAAKTPWDIRTDGATAGGSRRLRVYCSAETHTWIQKAADLSGIGTSAIRWIPTDTDQRMRIDLLARQIDEDLAVGDVPFMVVGTAGTVSTGAIDPLPQLAELCQARGLWFHVDGAYGGFAAASVEAPADLRALSLADSVAVDPHKWLYAPLEAGCAIVRNPDHMRAAFAYHPPYYHLDEHALNFVDFGMQNSRGFRALKVWLMLQQAGAAGYRQMISDDIALSRRLAQVVASDRELELVTQHLSITTFRFVPGDLRHASENDDVRPYLDKLNQALLDRLQREGRAFVSNAVVNGTYVLRACIVNFHTSAADIEALPGIVTELGRTLDRTMRSS